MTDTGLSKTQIFKLASLTDLIRLVVTHMNITKQGFLYYGFKDGKHIFFMTHLIPGWYELRGLPVSLIAFSDEAPKHNFIAYRIGDDNTEESWEYVEFIKTSTKIVHIPIIKIADFPDFLNIE